MSEAYRDGGFWFSKLSTGAECLRKYKLQHIDKIQAGEKGIDAECGTAMHLALNDILEGGDGEAIFLTYWNAVKGQEMQKFSYDWEALKMCAEKWLAKFKRLHAKHFEPVKMEERLFSTIGGHSFEGTADFIGMYKGVPSIVDFKTSGSRYDKRKIIADEQMPGYAKLAQDCLGFEAKQVVYYVFVKDRNDPSIQVVTKELTQEVLSSTIMNMREVMDDLASRKTFPRNTRSCVRGPIICPYFEHCFGKKEESNGSNEG